MKDDINFQPIKCPNCSGYGALGREPNRYTCPTCKGKGVIVVDQMTGKIISFDDDNERIHKGS